MSLTVSHLAAIHDKKAGGTSVAIPAACPFSSISQTAPSASTPAAGKKQRIDETKLCPIPQPPTAWLTGNLSELNPAFAAQSVWRLAGIYGDIFQLDLVSEKVIVVSSHELVRECFDQSRFDKGITGAVTEVRDLLGDGLFTGKTQEEVPLPLHLLTSSSSIEKSC